MSDQIELTHTSHVVLGLLLAAGEASPYDLKQMAAATIGNFWSLPHSQLYAEPARLAGAGYLTERREEHGRRRKLYALTDRGREAHKQWLEVLTPEPYMLRDLALLKLFFGADVQELARVQLETHRRKLAEYEQLIEQIAGYGPPGPHLALDLGTRHERQTVEFWEEHSQGPRPREAPAPPAKTGQADSPAS